MVHCKAPAATIPSAIVAWQGPVMFFWESWYCTCTGLNSNRLQNPIHTIQSSLAFHRRPWHHSPGNIETMPMSRWQLQDVYICHLTLTSSGLPVAIPTANCNLASKRNVSSVSFTVTAQGYVRSPLYILNAGHKAFLYLSCDLLRGSRGMTWLKRFNLKCCSQIPNCVSLAPRSAQVTHWAALKPVIPFTNKSCRINWYLFFLNS